MNPANLDSLTPTGAISPRCNSETGELRDVLVAPPDAAGLAAGSVEPGQYGFRSAANPELVLAEWNAFAGALTGAGAQIHDLCTIAPPDSQVLPNRHYPRDLAIVLGRRCLLSAPSPGRRWEMAGVKAALEEMGIAVQSMRAQVEFGDVFAASPSLVIAGRGPRTQTAGLRELRAAMEPDGWSDWLVVDFASMARDVRLAHLDLGFNVVGERTALVYGPLLRAPAKLHGEGGPRGGTFAELLETAGFDPVEVSGAIQARGGINVLSLRPRQVVAYDEALEAGLDELLAHAGVKPVAVPGHNLIRSGGGPRCMSMPLVRA